MAGSQLSLNRSWIDGRREEGDPVDDPGEEPIPNGGRINLAAYGETIHVTRVLTSQIGRTATAERTR